MPFADVAFSDGIWKKSAPHPHARRHTYTKRLHDRLKITKLMKKMIKEYFFYMAKKKEKKRFSDLKCVKSPYQTNTIVYSLLSLTIVYYSTVVFSIVP